MNLIVLVFGGLIFLTGVLMLIRPGIVIEPLAQQTDKVGLQIAAVLGRLLLGIALIVSAGDSRFPLLFEVLGWLSAGAAIVLALIGRQRFKALVAWALAIAPAWVKLAGVAATGLGALLIYGLI